MPDRYNQRWVSKLFGKGLPWAITLGSSCFYSVPKQAVSSSWRRHEEEHKAQWSRLGWRFLPIYLYYHIRYGYDKNPLEIEAREKSKLP